MDTQFLSEQAGIYPLQLVTGKAVTVPGLTMGNRGTESMTDCEAVQRTMKNLNRITSEFREAEMRKKLKDCQNVRVQSYQHLDSYIEGDLVWYQPPQGSSWLGPAAVLCHRGPSVWLHTMGDIKKVASCKVKPYDLIDRESMECKCKETSRKVMLEDGLEDVETIMDEVKEHKRSELRKMDAASDAIGVQYLKMENDIDLSDIAMFTVEIPVSEHGRTEVKEAKDTEIQNLMNYEVFEEVEENGQDTIGSQWVITAKEKHDGQKKNTKARLVVQGFKEPSKPQSDSPTVSKESFKLLMVVAANEGFRLASVDIRAAFLQSRTLDRDVFMLPPKDIRKPGIVWKLKKPLYGLDDASRKFWLRVKGFFFCSEEAYDGNGKRCRTE